MGVSHSQILSKLSCKRAIKIKVYSVRLLDNRRMYGTGYTIEYDMLIRATDRK